MVGKVHWEDGLYLGAPVMLLWIWYFSRPSFLSQRLVRAGFSHAVALTASSLQPILSANTVKDAAFGLASIM